MDYTKFGTVLGQHQKPIERVVPNIAHALQNYLPLSGGDISGNINMGNNKIFSLADPTGDKQAANKQYVDSTVNSLADAAKEAFVRVDGTNEMTGNLNAGNKRIINIAPPMEDTDASTKSYVDSKVGFNGDMKGKKIINMRPPTEDNDAATKKYVDDSQPSRSLTVYEGDTNTEHKFQRNIIFKQSDVADKGRKTVEVTPKIKVGEFLTAELLLSPPLRAEKKENYVYLHSGVLESLLAVKVGRDLHSVYEVSGEKLRKTWSQYEMSQNAYWLILVDQRLEVYKGRSSYTPPADASWFLLQELTLDQQFYPALELYNKYNPPVQFLMLQIPDILHLSESLPEFGHLSGSQPYHNTEHNYYLEGPFSIERNPNKIIPGGTTFKFIQVLNKDDTNLLKGIRLELEIEQNSFSNESDVQFYTWNSDANPPKPPGKGWVLEETLSVVPSWDPTRKLSIYMPVPYYCKNVAAVFQFASGTTEIHNVIVKAKDSIIYKTNKEISREAVYKYINFRYIQ